MKLSLWTEQFHKIYSKALEKYRNGAGTPKKMLTAPQIRFLETIGVKPVNMFDWVEDFAVHGEPGYEVAVLLAANRREFFLIDQKGKPSKKTIPNNSLPARPDAHAGLVWLPRITVKARGFLRGELADETMFCCGGDRKFLKANQIHPTDFLRIVEQFDGDLGKLARYINKQRS